MNNELYHYGIKGMKWGVRRYQNPNGSLTEAGKRRYNQDVLDAKQRLEKANAALGRANTSYNIKAKDYKNIVLDQKNAQEDYGNAKIKARIESNGGLTKAQEKYKKKYLAKGMNDEEASIAAYKYDRTKKALMVCAGVSIAAVGGYAAYRYRQHAFDKTIPKNTVLSRISTNNNQGVKDSFYAVLDKNKGDKTRYAGIYGARWRDVGVKVFEKKITASDNLRIASPKNAATIMGKALDHFNVRENPEEFEVIRDILARNARSYKAKEALVPAKLFDKAVKELYDYKETGKVGKHLYGALNVELANHRSGITREFYEQLRDAGYDGVKDMNDGAYSGFMSKFPIIIANASKVKVSEVRRINNAEISSSLITARKLNVAKSFVEQVAPVYAMNAGAFGAATVVNNKIITAQRDAIVRNYRKDHPNTKLSYNEIVRMTERNRINES